MTAYLSAYHKTLWIPSLKSLLHSQETEEYQVTVYYGVTLIQTNKSLKILWGFKEIKYD